MNQDPYYQSILAGLNGPLDPQAFEDVVPQLLTRELPGIVPIRGGQDAGFDGAVPDGAGEPYPLITTTAQRVLGNLKRNLASYLHSGGPRRKTVLATSRDLTPRQIRNLHSAASALGFTLVAVFIRRDIADRLYRHPDLASSLLGVAGNPPPLSRLPVRSRPGLLTEPIGRDEALHLLSEAEADVVLEGQPGSGKTCILRHLADQGRGLFVADTNMELLANAIRAQQPTMLFVDDAHLDPDFLTRLAHRRRELGWDFRIVASCWPGALERIQAALVEEATTCSLEPLTRAEIAAVIERCGVVVPRELLRELISQSAGRPGLAVLLCTMLKRGGLESIISGELLFRDVRVVFGRLVGEHATNVLGCFAVGGSVGMFMHDVADHLGLPLSELQVLSARLASGGVLSVGRDQRLAVQPDALRWALVAGVFFSGDAPLPFEPLHELAPDPDELTLTLIHSRARTANVPDTLIRERLLHARSDEPWVHYASLGRYELAWVLRTERWHAGTLGRVGLRRAPDLVLDRLLHEVANDPRETGPHPDHPLRLITDWATSGYPGTDEGVIRRRDLLIALEGADVSTEPLRGAVRRALPIVFSPSYQYVGDDPANPRTVTFERGALAPSEIAQVSALWPRGLQLLRRIGLGESGDLDALIRPWIHPLLLGSSIPEETRLGMLESARVMLDGIVTLASDSPGIIAWAVGIYERLGWAIDLDEDPVYKVLFPRVRSAEWREFQEEQREAASDLAEQWALDNPILVAARFTFYEAESMRSGHAWPTWTGHVAGEIAQRVANPADWVSAFLEAEVAAEILRPFVSRLVGDEHSSADRLWRACLEHEKYRAFAVIEALAAANPTPSMIDQSLNSMSGLERAVDFAVGQGDVKEARLASILDHEHRAIRAAVARGMWRRYGEEIPPALVASWRRAAILDVEDTYPLEEIFSHDPELAFGWLGHRLEIPSDSLWKHDDSVAAAIAQLGVDRRIELIERMGGDTGRFWLPGIAAQLVSKDSRAYERLLARSELAPVHLAPLGNSDLTREEWINLALLALAAGYPPSEIAGSVYRSWGWTGNLSDMWTEFVQRFSNLEDHDDPLIREIGRIGREETTRRRDEALLQERHEAVYGY